jgi:hypothetical protein
MQQDAPGPGIKMPTKKWEKMRRTGKKKEKRNPK